MALAQEYGALSKNSALWSHESTGDPIFWQELMLIVCFIEDFALEWLKAPVREETPIVGVVVAVGNMTAVGTPTDLHFDDAISTSPGHKHLIFALDTVYLVNTT